MIRNIISLLLFILPGFLFGQSLDSIHDAAVGNSKVYFLIDSNITNYASISGSGAMWDYSTAGGYDGAVTLMSIEDPAATAYSADYPNSTKTTTIDGFLIQYFDVDENEKSCQGFVINDDDLGEVKAVYSSDEQVLLEYPFAFSTENEDQYLGNVSFNYNGNPETASCYGNGVTSFDGKGSFVAPNGAFFQNVYRLKYQDTTVATSAILGNIELIREQYEYYAYHEGDTMPIFVHSSIKMLSGFPNPLLEYSVVLSKYDAVAMSGLSENVRDFKLYPNPTSGHVNIIGLKEATQIEVMDLNGKILSTQYSETIDLSDLNHGVYLIRFPEAPNSGIKRIVKN